MVVATVSGRAALILHLPLDTKPDFPGAPEAQSVKGVISNAIAFQPSDNGWVVARLPQDLKPASAVSIGCWFKSERPPAGEVRILEVAGCRLAATRETGCASFSVTGVKGMLAGIAPASRAVGFTGICDGQWHHLVGQYDGTLLSLFVDGVLEEVFDASGQITTNAAGVVLGRAASPSARAGPETRCYVDDVRIHDEALSDIAIAACLNRKPQQRGPAAGRRLDLHRDFLDKGVFPIQAHRGGGLSLPENTLETYRDTWAKGMIPEADIRTTRDGVIICMHDADLSRLSPKTPAPLRTTPFEQMRLAQVQTFDVGAFRGRPGQRVPTLEEVFQEMRGHPGRMLEIDYKRIDLDKLAALVTHYELRNQVIFVTRFHHLIRQWQRISPGAMTVLWMGGSEAALDQMFAQLRRDDFAGISILQIILFKNDSTEGFRPSVSSLQERQTELARRGIVLQVIPWEIAEPRVFEKLLAAGIRFFGTDFPETALDAYKRLVPPKP